MPLSQVIFGVVGGLGLFLLGMTLMTEGLRAMAGDRIRDSLRRVTRSPLSGVMTGLASTALLQSSSATIIATVGFVGAGFLSFYQALSIILGSALGTTVTGWLVALLGFKLQLGSLATVLVLAGAFMRLFGGPSVRGLGYGLAGFGLIFIGIDALQEGLGGLKDYVDFSQWEARRLWGKLKLVLVGIGFTIITQSSSAGVVAALTAMVTGAIVFEQAAALVVGMNIGTSFTAAAATIGGNIHVRRTGFSHVVYNSLVSGMALFLITPYIWLWQRAAPALFEAQSEFALVGFHTAFNLLGVVLVLPFVRYFARMIERLFPDKTYGYQQILDRGMLKYPELALTAVQKVLRTQIDRIGHQLGYILGDMPRPGSLDDTETELQEIQAYLDSIHLESTSGSQWERLLAAIQVVDHLQRLLDRCGNKSVQLALSQDQELEAAAASLRELAALLTHKKFLDAKQVRALIKRQKELERNLRQSIMARIGEGRLELREGVALMDSARWLKRVASHIQRIDQGMRQLNYDKSHENTSDQEA